MKYDKKRVIQIVTESAKNYDKFLNNKQFLIIYQTKTGTDYAEVCFREMNYKHLTGIKSSLTAIQFYEACKDSRLAEDEIDIDNEGKVRQKLSVLPYLHALLYHNCMIGDFINSGVMIQADYFVGDTKLVLSVGFRRCKSSYDRPVSLYCGDVRKMTNPTNKVLVIFKKTISEDEYKEIAYSSKNLDVSSLNIPAELSVDLNVLEKK